jgi:regulator of nucleoside diphosphate kinase
MGQKKTILITEPDMKRLLGLLAGYRHSARHDQEHLLALEQELQQAEVVPAAEIPADVVTVNSCVRLRDLDTGRQMEYTLVFPTDAGMVENRISVLAPIGTAVLGYRQGDRIDWQAPGGRRRMRIEEVVYQPEAAGDLPDRAASPQETVNV